MSNIEKKTDTAAESKQEGIDIKKVTFDENGEVAGLDDEALKDVSGGRISEDYGTNFGCDEKC